MHRRMGSLFVHTSCNPDLCVSKHLLPSKAEPPTRSTHMAALGRRQHVATPSSQWHQRPSAKRVHTTTHLQHAHGARVRRQHVAMPITPMAPTDQCKAGATLQR